MRVTGQRERARLRISVAQGTKVDHQRVTRLAHGRISVVAKFVGIGSQIWRQLPYGLKL